MKRLLPVFITVLCFLFSVNSSAYQSIIVDDADLFNVYEETEISTVVADYTNIKGFSLAVVTTEYTSGLSSEEYACDYLDYLIDNEGFQENALLFLIDMDNRNVWISTSGECIPFYNDNEIDSIIDSGYNSLVNGEYSQCILEMTETAKNIENEEWIYVENSDEYNYNDFEDDLNYYDSFGLSDVLICSLIGLAVGGITVFAVKSRYKNQGKGDEFDSDDIVLDITASNDTIISRNVITTRIPKNNNTHHGGSRGGGASVHRSGSSRPHGGGGRRF